MREKLRHFRIDPGEPNPEVPEGEKEMRKGKSPELHIKNTSRSTLAWMRKEHSTRHIPGSH